MSILIHGTDMPKEGFVELLVRDDGTVLQTGQSYRIDGKDYYSPYVGEIPNMYKAAQVPPHGRLGDLDELAEKHRELAYEFSGANYDFHMTAKAWVDNAPTVIPAEPKEEA